METVPDIRPYLFVEWLLRSVQAKQKQNNKIGVRFRTMCGNKGSGHIVAKSNGISCMPTAWEVIDKGSLSVIYLRYDLCRLRGDNF